MFIYVVFMADTQVVWMPFGPNPDSSVPRTIYNGMIQYRDIIEPYMPGRVLRQIGYVQNIPIPILRPVRASRPWKCVNKYVVEFPEILAMDQWTSFPVSGSLHLNMLQRATEDPAACDPRYLEWYIKHSHPRLLCNSMGEGDGDDMECPPRANSTYVSFI